MNKLKRALHRAARSALFRYLRAPVRRGRGRPDGDGEVVILLVSAWGMGGTIRAALNLAGYLARERDVEIISMFRKREEPFFGSFPPDVKVTALDDRRESARPKGVAGLLYRVLTQQRSVLVHPADRWAGEYFNLWTDVQLVRSLRGRRGWLVATRPGFNIMAAELSPPGLLTIGQEQMHLHHHVKALRAAMPAKYPKLDAFVVLTEGHKRDYDKLLRDRGRVEVIPNTVRDMGGSPADLSSRTLFAAGRLVDQKGFDLLIRAYAPVAEAHPDWRLRICGQGQRRPDLERLVAEHGLGDVVSLEPPSRNIGDDMASSSVFVLSSRFEGFPLILLEAMSKRMGIVAYDCPTGPGEIVDDHRNGLLVPEQDVPGLTAAMLEIIEDEDLRRRCAAAAAETAQRYTIDAVGPRWDALLDDLYAGGRDPLTAPPASRAAVSASR